MTTTSAPAWLRSPDDVNALLPQLWPATVRRRPSDGVLTVAGLDIRDLAGEYGTPAYLVDEADFRARARAFHDAFAAVGADVAYAGKAFLCTEVARWVGADGLGLDVCTGGELAVAQRAGFPAERLTLHGNNKSSAELDRALVAGVGRIVLDSADEIVRLAHLCERRGIRARVLIRVTTGVQAATHDYIATAHEDQKFGFSLTGGDAAEAIRRIRALPGLELVGLHSHVGSQIFDPGGFEVAARRLLGLVRAVADEHGDEPLPHLCLGGGFGIAYTSQDTPRPPAELAAAMAAAIAAGCAELELPVPRLSVEPGRAIAGPSTFTLYEVGTVKDAGGRRYVAVGRRDERQHQGGAVRRCLLGHPRLPPIDRRSSTGPGGRQALRIRRRAGQGRVPARRHRRGRSTRGAGHRRLLPLAGQQLQPRPATAGGSGAGRAGPGYRAPGDRGGPAPARRLVLALRPRRSHGAGSGCGPCLGTRSPRPGRDR
ncbi:MAG: diaminopimelate decarboxylase [Sporichthyaceae bacterium]|nr:diaminopimelate decarboxylase [Sporichthyaceae bacterium]